MSVIKDVIEKIKQTDPNQPEFHQAVAEVMETLEPTVKKRPDFLDFRVKFVFWRGKNLKNFQIHDYRYSKRWKVHPNEPSGW